MKHNQVKNNYQQYQTKAKLETEETLEKQFILYVANKMRILKSVRVGYRKYQGENEGV